MTRYYLSDGVFFCGQRDAIVFLDLKQDEYTLLSPDETALFRSYFLDDLMDTATEKLLRELTDARILTTRAEIGKAVIPTYVVRPREGVTPEYLNSPQTVPASAALRFAWACTIAAMRLRTQSIERVVSAVARRNSIRRSSVGGDDPQSARLAVTFFFRLRALFPKNYLCLFDSLALLEFLAAYSIFPHWVFGVRVEPWAAHCWIQQRDFILNDDVEEISDYIPILAV
jgi:hypothetical protein